MQKMPKYRLIAVAARRIVACGNRIMKGREMNIKPFAGALCR